MAPMTRNNALIPHADGVSRAQENFREASWHFLGPDRRGDRDTSEGPASSYDEGDIILGFDGEDEEYEKQAYEAPEDHEDILHPLREAANRVGREVERFAEQHASARGRGRKDDLRWRNKMEGFKITHDEDEMDLEDSDEQEGADLPTTVEDLERWEQEAQTWDLLRRLVKLRYPPPGEDKSKLLSRHPPLNQYSTERDIWETFLESDGLALERKTVLQWLNDTAEESGEEIDVLVKDLQQNAERGDMIAHGWLHTKTAIKKQKRLHTWPQILDPSSPEVQRVHLNSSNTEPLVTQLDPDSTTRQGRKLEAQDEYFERAIWLGCYEMLRRGRNPAEFRDWCVDRTEVWRAVSMSGLPDERFGDDENKAGNPASSALWRRMCFALARRGGGDDYERAVYGILSGDISTVEPVCRSWGDYVFVHYNALLRTQFDNFLQKIYLEHALVATISNFGVFDAVQFHGDPKSAGQRLVEGLKTNSKIAKEASQPMKMLQGVLIADQFDNFIYQQGLALSKFANAEGVSNLIPATRQQPENEEINKYITLDDHDSLRVLTHVLLVFVSLGLDLGGVPRQSVVENVIVSYISFLRLAGKEELIPLYCSQLSGARRYATLSRNLIDVTDHGQRVTQIKLMRELGLDVQEFVKFQSRYLLADYPDNSKEYPAIGNFKLLEDGPGSEETGRKIRKDFFGDDPDRVDRIDMLLIRSLEWYLLVDGLWSETFIIGTMLYMRFFKHMHLPAARMLATKVPSTEIARSKTRSILGESLDFHNLENEDDEDLTEVLDGAAEQRRLLKRHLVAQAKSFRELETLIESLDAIETVTSMGNLMLEDTSIQWQKAWRQQLARALQPTKASMQPLLKGWLLTSQEDEPEFQLLREAYLPETLLAYVITLQYAGATLTRDFLMECMDISSVVAAEGSDLLDLFVKTGRMQELVEAFANASKELLILTSARPGGSSRSKKLRAKGWTPELWSVKN
ncbi:hypothetical protein B7494_g8097 [Chlorociboria aeruginascens]|nr:hypothetical protein B7494_g8097 [Chlorociboria aeruginascens]